MTNSENSITTKDVLGQGAPPVFIKTEETIDKPEKVDYSKVYVLPTIKTRYFSMLIDVLVLVLLALGISMLFDTIGEVPGFVRGIVFGLVMFCYEPILVTFGSTIGQLFLNIRVRSFKNPDNKVAFLMVVIRFVVKVLLGWLSFITVTFNINRRAIHDFISGSIVISKKIDNK
jgi:uncharacterized RDD family membrane protein YckC